MGRRWPRPTASIAPGSASDVGLQAADFVFVQELAARPAARGAALRGATMRVVKQNFALAIGYNMLAVPLAMAGLRHPDDCGAGDVDQFADRGRQFAAAGAGGPK